MPNQSNSPDLSSNQFSVDKPSIASVPVPSANPMNTAELGASNQALATLRGDAMIASRPQSSGSSGGGGIGGIIGPIASIIGSIFAEGGIVTNGYAGGGQVEEDVPYIEPPAAPQPQPPVATDQKMGGMGDQTIGYLIGALHQAKYGGTPDTLAEAAKEIKQHLELQNNRELSGGQLPSMGNEPVGSMDNINRLPKPGMASGGMVDDTQLAQAALMKAMGLGPGSEDQMQQPQANQQQMQPQPQVPATAPIQNKASPQPYSRGYADGGPTREPTPRERIAAAEKSINTNVLGQPIKMQTGYADGGPPLQPGQSFAGDGEVNGPGGPQDDAIPAKLSDGEFVFSQPAVQFFGVDKLVKMNEQGKQGFMQAMGQVQANQPQAQPGTNPGAPAAPPMAPPTASPGMMQKPPQAPMMQASGGPSISMRRGTGYAGL